MGLYLFYFNIIVPDEINMDSYFSFLKCNSSKLKVNI